ncbi:trichoplein keratin filament-binding protein-like [Zootermopsis nevadensis]|uniref:Trichoplein keratin filament-binding protein n=1 Tax=Zootermopsis nevadensis TaxID=136037 RepID=A0A067QTQ4_ZOONE|nr:trichoplein keratin filament-binding protein-like [Zootermopsis nevadensis]XP_021940813.1 trichoplein keratin filament-binding protein-like [Zootermopsis nevadensis]KDR07309.1 Trichoplein keratin filament-binding protein [Zootermopsis nevadensis]
MSSQRSAVTFSCSRRNRQEEALVRRRNAEADHQQLWDGITQYFHTWDIQSNKHNDWASPRYYSQSMEMYNKAMEAQKKAQRLEERQQKLAALLYSETRQYEIELARQRGNPSIHHRMPLEELKSVNYELKRREEENQRREAELKLYHQWRMKQPSITELERKQHGHFVREAWVKQTQEKQVEREKAEKEQLEAMKEREAMQLAEEERQKKSRALSLQSQLKQQIAELRDREKKAEELQREESEVMQRRAKLEDLLMERRSSEERRKKAELGSFLQRQYQLKLRRRAKEVQEKLTEDLHLLEKLMSMEMEENRRASEQQEAARREMLCARQALAEQARVEREREKHMEFLFNEEAQRMWTQQEDKWNRECEARERLLTEVLVTVQHQLEERLEANLAEQRDLVRSREELVAHIEQVNAELKEQRAALNKMKEERRKEIDIQVSDKQQRQMAEARIAELEAEKQKVQEKLEEQKLLQELRKMETTGYNPVNVARRRMFW